MPNYRRVFVAGCCDLFSVDLLDCNGCLWVEHIDRLRTAVHETRQLFAFEIDALLILPDQANPRVLRFPAVRTKLI